MAKAGRPTKFKEDYIRLARIHFGEDGYTDIKFCKLLEIGRRTFNDWREAHPEFAEAVQEGKDEFDTDRVEGSLKKRALGFRFTEKTREPCLIRKKGQTPELIDVEMTVTKTVGKVVPPDTVAAIFWLKNRRRDRWRDIKAQEISGPEGGPIPIDLKGLLKDLSTNELRILKDIAVKAAGTGNS